MIEEIKGKYLKCNVCLNETTAPVDYGVTAKKMRADAQAEQDPWYRLRLNADQLAKLTAEQRKRVGKKMIDIGPICYAIISSQH